jgi:uncharacterized repeat protein (TIGR01451 family)
MIGKVLGGRRRRFKPHFEVLEDRTLPAAIQFFYVPMPEADTRAALVAIAPATTTVSNNMTSIIALTATQDNTIIYYDHWEDGYEANLDNIVQSTTQIWGDGNPSNGIAPGFVSDIINAGDVIKLRNNVPANPRDPASIFFDGGDRIAASQTIAASRVQFPVSPGSVIGSAVEFRDTRFYDTAFTAPVGNNTLNAGNMFAHTSFFIMAAQDNTTVQIDRDNDGTFETTVVLNQGQNYRSVGNVLQGGRVVANKPVQVHLLTGDIGAQYASRSYALFSDNQASNDYFTPVGLDGTADPVRIYVYNPNATSITVNFETQTTSGSFVVAAASSNVFIVPNLLPILSGTRLYSTSKFLAAGAHDALDTVHDWGFSLQPVSALSQIAVVGLGVGNSNDPPAGSGNTSPVWVTALANTTLNVDYDGDGVVDATVPVVRLQSVKLRDPSGDDDNSGMRIFTTDGTLIATAWGEDITAPTGSPGFDVGTTVPALPVPEFYKLVEFAPGGDANGDGFYNSGDTIRYTLRIRNIGTDPISNAVVTDVLPAGLTYVPNSTFVDQGVGPVAVPDAGNTTFPLDESGFTVANVAAATTTNIFFDATIDAALPAGTTSISNFARLAYQFFDLPAVNTITLRGSIGDRVWHDVNGNGVQDPGEPGIVGANLTLTWFGVDGVLGGGDDLTFNTTTGANGSYLFSNLREGNHTLAVTSIPNGLTTATAGVSNITLGAGEFRSNADFGYRGNASIGDRFWLDQDGDGVQDAGELGLGNVTVSLTWAGQDGDFATTADNLTFNTTTSANGSYSFTNLAAGSYSMLVEPTSLPLGITIPTFDLDGVGTANLANFTLTAGQVRTDVDFGYRGNASIGDRLWLDQDGDGVQDPNEPGLANVTLTLTWAGQDGDFLTTADNLVLNTTTAANGTFTFANLAAGNFSVLVESTTLPTGITTLTFDVDGTTTPNGANITLAAGESRLDVDFGYAGNLSLGGSVWYDVNANGAVDAGEPNFAGVTVTVTWAGQDNTLGTSDDGVFTAVTLADGTYNVASLPPGDYLVTIGAGLPANLAPTFDVDGIATPGQASLTGVAVSRGDLDFGYTGTNTIAGFVFQDTNNNGAFEPGAPHNEQGIAGVSVTLTGIDDLGASITRTLLTAASGSFSFANLRPGTYTLTETQPAGYGDGQDTAGSTFGGAPAALGTDVIANISIPAGANNTSDDGYRFAEQLVTSLSGAVFLDLDNDGVFNGADTGIGGVNLTLTGNDFLGNAVNVSATTAANGTFTFSGLLPSDAVGYTLTQTQPAAYNDGLDTPGTGAAAPGTQTANGALDVISGIVLAGGNNAVDYFFGERGTTLSGFVYVDANRDGVRQSTETGLGGVRLTLLDADGQVAATTLSALFDGAYAFANLPAGTYTLVQSQPAGYGSSTPNLLTNLSVPVTGLANVSFGETTATISGLVYFDANGDGVFTTGELGIDDVVITLTGVDVNGNAVIRTTASLSDGTYRFDGLLSGTYAVTQAQPTGFADGNETLGGAGGALVAPDTISGVALGAGVVASGYNFGEQGTALGGVVYIDFNGNGVREAGEPGLANVSVTILDSVGTAVAVVQTAADGSYLVGGLTPGNYRVIETQPSGFTSSTPDSLNVFVPAAGLTSVNFGETTTLGRLLGSTYLDLNNDGIRQAGEPGIGGVTITLTGSDAAGNAVARSVVSAADGTYLFTLLPASNAAGYTLTQTQPTGYADGLDTAGDLGGTAGNDVITGIVLPAGAVAAGYNFGERGAVLTGRVFVDANSNGVRDPGEIAGVGGVFITLTTRAGVIVATTTSAADGTYSFLGVVPGDYLITETQPVGFGSSTPNTLVVTVPPAGLADQNFGETQASNLAGFVYVDLNNNGLRDANEPGLANVTLSLTGPVSQNVTTGADGSYVFSGLAPGVYTVTQAQPAGFSDGPETVGSAGGTPTPTDTIANIPLGALDSAKGYDFAELPAAGTGTITGSVFLDNNANGTRDAGDPGLGGIAITLLDGLGNFVAVTTTAVDGTYTFFNLAPGTYQVRQAQPLGYGSSTPDVSAPITLAGGGTSTVLFGETLGTISGRVFGDNNNNGLFDGVDFAISGVAITLTGTDVNGAPVLRTTTTAADGTYVFVGLLAGTYAVTETQPVTFFDGLDSLGGVVQAGSIGTDTLAGLVLAAGATAGENNFAEVPPGDPLGFVFIDANNNGVFDPGEAGIEGTTITLTGTDVFGNAVLLTTITDATGFYQFANIAPGVYNLFETQPTIAGTNELYLDGLEENGTPPAGIVGNDVFQNIDLTQAPFFGGGYNFGELRPSSISGAVFLDTNSNGVRDGNEPALPGVVINLTGTDDLGRAVAASVSTDAAGAFSFRRLRPGTYTISQVQPASFQDGADFVGAGTTAVGIAANDAISGIVVGENQAGAGFRFTERGGLPQFVSKRSYLTIATAAPPLGTPGSGVAFVKPVNDADPAGYVYIDANANGVRDPGEAGIAGVQIILTGTTVSGASVWASKLTDTSGFYQFDQLEAGVYAVRQVQPAGYDDGAETLGSLGGVVGNDEFTNIVLGPNDLGVGYNFGELVRTAVTPLAPSVAQESAPPLPPPSVAAPVAPSLPPLIDETPPPSALVPTVAAPFVVPLPSPSAPPPPRPAPPSSEQTPVFHLGLPMPEPEQSTLRRLLWGWLPFVNK